LKWIAGAWPAGDCPLAISMHGTEGDADVMVGGEVQWGKRENFRDDFTSDDVRFQFSARYNFSTSIGGQ